MKQAKRPSYALLVAALAAAIFLEWLGSSAVLPLLPLYLRGRGSSPTTIGMTISAFFVGGMLAQYLAGRLGDRIGHRPVLVSGLAGYALASTGFLLPLGDIGYIALRGLQGAAAGSAQVAALALVAQVVPAHARGRAFAALYGAELAGIAIGPFAGTLVGLRGMSTLFVGAGLGALLGCIPVLASRALALDAVPAADATAGQRVIWRGTAGRTLIGVLMAAVVGGMMTGVYEACWTLLLNYRGATTAEIGLSWTLYAVPFVVLSPLAGWLADHADRRRLVLWSVTATVLFCALYPFLPGVAWLLALGSLEGVGVAIAIPAAQSLLSDAVPAAVSGQAQGLFATTQTATIAISAGGAGALFSVRPWLPFVVTAVVGTGLLVALLPVWRGVAGRVNREAPVAVPPVRVSA